MEKLDNAQGQTRPRLSSKRRRIFSAAFLIIGVITLLFYSRHRSVDIEAEYRLAVDRSELTALHVLWTGEDDKYVEASFHYHDVAPRTEHQSLSLSTGSYELRFTLSYRDGTSQQVNRTVEVDEEGLIEFSLP